MSSNLRRALRRGAPLFVLVLSACGSGPRSPDVPLPELKSFSVSCNPDGPLAAGKTAQCAITDCIFTEVTPQGQKRDVAGACPTPKWSTSPASVASINGGGELTATGSGKATVTASSHGKSQSTAMQVFEPQLVSATVVCTPSQINAGQTAQCSANSCTVRYLDENGAERTETRQCPDVTWSASPASVGSIDDTGRFTGIGAGTAAITGHVGNLTPQTNVTVAAACISGVALEPVTSTVVAGQSQVYKAIATFSNNTRGDVTSTTTFASNQPAVTFGAGPGNATAATDRTLAAAIEAVITGTVSNNTCSGQSASASAKLTVQPAQIISNGLCLERAANEVFTGCRADTGACPITALTLAPNQTQQLRLRARFNNGQECNVTNDSGSRFSSSETNVATVTTADPPGRGLVTALNLGRAEIRASTTVGGTTVDATPVLVTVRVEQMLGSNSLSVSAKSFSVSAQPRKFACVGATDVVAGLADKSQLQGQQRLFAGARFCSPEQLEEDRCTAFLDDPAQPPRDVTNDDGTAPGNRIAWSQRTGFWDGTACATMLSAEEPAPALVGDQLTPASRYPGTRLPGENGVVVAAGNLRVGFSCITAEYINPAYADNQDADGMTVLVLPVTNDVLLGPSSAQDATELCDALEPLFQLGADSNGGNGAVTQLLSVVTEIVNPILQSIAKGQEAGNEAPIPVDDLVNRIIAGLSVGATSQLFAAGLGEVVAAVDGGYYKPLTCGVGALLTALTTSDPNVILSAQACLPAPGP